MFSINKENKNKKNNLLVISSYPEKGLVHGVKTVGVASYSKNTLNSIIKNFKDIKISVYADILNEPKKYIDNNILVQRNWKRGNLLSILILYFKIVKNPTKNILLQFEMYMLGNIFHTATFVFLLPILKLFKKDVTIVLHQVVIDINIFESNPFKVFIFNLVRPLFYKYLIFSCNKVIVFEQELKDRLNKKNIFVIEHAVELVNIINSDLAKRKLMLDTNKDYVMVFGYISPYKGILELIDSYNPKTANYQIIIAGGINPNYSNSKKHIDYYEKIKKISKIKNIITTNYIPQENIKYYFSACSLVVLPYKVFMSSSGPLSLALSYEKPFLVSENLNYYFKSKDFKKLLKEINLNKQDFYINFANLNQSIDFCIKNNKKFIKFSKSLKYYRNWDDIAKKYYTLIFSN